MEFLRILGRHLKDEEVIEVLECAGMEVVYAFDRTHENLPDVYWASASELGFQLRFDAAQILTNVFIHVVPDEGFEAVDPSECDVPLFSSIAEAMSHAEGQGMKTVSGKTALFGIPREWVRLESETRSLHYEFRSGRLALVTLTLVRPG